MKKVYILSLAILLFSACGGGGSPSNSGSLNIVHNKLTGFKGYILSDYLFANSDKKVEKLQYKNGEFYQKETLSYSVSNSNIKLRSLTNLGGYIDFNIIDDKKIDVNIYQDAKQNSFSMKNYLDLNHTVTTKDGECKLAKHFDIFKYDGKSYDDVIEIDCPKSKGYYQKHNGLVVENSLEDIKSNDLEYLPDFKDREIAPVDKSDSKLGVLNLDSAREANVDKLWDAPYYLNGEGMKIGLVDGGAVLTSHVELRGRVHNLSNSRLNRHATHTAGTLISSGVHLPSSRGFAKDANLYALDYHDLYFADAVKKLLDYGVLISNHSYGFEGADGLGVYDKDSKNFDELIAKNPYIIAVVAAGNDGRKYRKDSDFSYWSLIKGGANAKNVITVAAEDDGSGYIADFSSRGPIKGGRLKPDIALDGFNVLSTIVNIYDVDDDSYGRLYGTSMAAPAVTGTIALLSQRYKEINVDGSNPRVDTIKAIIFNTAKDIENPGPDFKSGFGHLDALSAVRVIDSMRDDNSLVKLESIRQNEHLLYNFKAKNYEEFKVTVAWVDDGVNREGLVNDIDIYLEDLLTHQKIYPFTLDEFNPNRPAINTKPNHIDPQEQIVFSLIKGRDYRLHILGTKIPDVKEFTLVSSIPLPKAITNMKVAPMREQVHDIYDSIK